MTTQQEQHQIRRSSAIRMARLRDRRKRGFVCYVIEICDADIERLVRSGYLDRQRRDEPLAVQWAIAEVLQRV
jgi:hypothetical protein